MDDTSPTRRWSDLLLEIASVVFAVLLALAVDEWWEEREDVERARETTRALVQEIRQNRAQLLRGPVRGEASDQLAALDSAIASYRRGSEPSDVSVNWNVALLSSAAWETARMTGATQEMPLDRVIDLAQLYEFQGYFERNQDELTSAIADLGSRMESEPVETLIGFRARYGTASALRRSLATSQACTLVQIEGPEAVEEGACPEGGNGALPDDSNAGGDETGR